MTVNDVQNDAERRLETAIYSPPAAVPSSTAHVGRASLSTPPRPGSYCLACPRAMPSRFSKRNRYLRTPGEPLAATVRDRSAPVNSTPSSPDSIASARRGRRPPLCQRSTRHRSTKCRARSSSHPSTEWGTEPAARGWTSRALDELRTPRSGRRALFGCRAVRPSRHHGAMNPQPPAGQAGRFAASVLPARAVDLVSEGSRDGVRRAIQEASTRWAGACEPIVQVSADGTITGFSRSVLENARVAGAVNVDVPDDRATEVAASLGLDLVPIAAIDRWGTTSFTSHPAGIGLGAETVDGSNGHVIAASDSSLWQAVAAGDLSPEHEAQLRLGSLVVRRARFDYEVIEAQFWGTPCRNAPRRHSEKTAPPPPQPTPPP